jgi:hypothetical protein
MYGLTRGAMTLVGVAVAGFLIWLGADALPSDAQETAQGEFWWAAGLIAAAGLVMALSQLLGGWTKWGWPRISVNVLLLGFLPALIVGGWVVAVGEPGDHWLGSHVRNWSDDIGVESVVGDLLKVWPALAFGVGLTFGLTFDTTGPTTEPVRWRKRRTVPAPAEESAPEARNGEPDDRRARVREEDAEGDAPQPEAAPRSGEPRREE